MSPTSSTRRRLKEPPRPIQLRVASQPTRVRAPGAPPAVLGHMGAPVVAAPNTAEGFLAAKAAGADGIELDLIAVQGGAVLVAHDLGDATSRPDALALDQLGDLLAREPLAGSPVLFDLKSTGTERALSAAMIGAALAPRAIISTTEPAILKALGLAAPAATRSQTFPRSRRDPNRHAISRSFARARRPSVRLMMPALVARAAQSRHLDAVTVHHELATPALRRLTLRLDIELLVWTVDDASRAAEMIDLGVDAIITNDPEMVVRVRAAHEPRDAPAPRSPVGIRFGRRLFRG